jgi:hypothetical protein
VRFILLTILVLLSPVAALAMGDLSGDGPTTRVPEPSIDFTVVVTDTEMNPFEVTKATFDGHVYLTGTVGKAKVSVPFEKIQRVDFVPAEGIDVTALITFTDGKQQALLVKGTLPAYGQTAYGNVAIELRYLRDAVFKGRTK